MKNELTAQRARELLDYDPETGEFRWKVTRGGVTRGSIAGYIDPDGYRHIRIAGYLYLAHRLAWLITHGSWPTLEIDHRNVKPGDDRIKNLREATRAQNHQNIGVRSDNTSGYKGVSFDRINRKWVARIRVTGGRYKNLGRFPFPDQAHAAYIEAARDLHGEFARAA